MRTVLTAFILILLHLVSLSANAATVAPDWTLPDASGQAITLSKEAEDRTTVLLFWATWCPYCKALMPHLQSMKLEYGEDIQILALSIKEDGDPVGFIENAAYDFTSLTNGDAVAELYGVRGTPGVFIIGQDRMVRFDLRHLPRIEPPDEGKPAGNARKAAYRTPYWAAEIRKAIDSDIASRNQ